MVLLRASDALSPEMYILAGSSLLSAWGDAGEYTMLAELAGPAGQLAANSLASGLICLDAVSLRRRKRAEQRACVQLPAGRLDRRGDLTQTLAGVRRGLFQCGHAPQTVLPI